MKALPQLKLLTQSCVKLTQNISEYSNCVWDGPQVGQSLRDLSFSLCSTLFLHISSYEYFILHSKNDRSIHTLNFILLELHVVCELYLGCSELWG